MFSIVQSLFGRSYQNLIKVEVSTNKLLKNYQYLSALNKNIDVAPVLKSNAYGHGINLVAEALDQCNAPFFCVDSLYEAYELLKVGIKTKILVMGYVDPANLSVKKLPFSYAVFSQDVLEGIAQNQLQAGIHIFVDTGMHREGIPLEELPDFLKQIKNLNLNVEGLMSHFGMAEKPNDSETISQVKNFEKAQEIVKSNGFNPKWVHICASSGLLNNKQFSKYKIGNVARAGIASYGISPINDKQGLQPALKFTTRIAQIKHLKKGDKVGYDFAFTASKDMTIGILPVGYNDGLDRRLSNKGFVTINNISCPIIGRVSMNITNVDLSEVKNPKVGDEVIVYSDNTKDKNSIENAAKLCGTIPYDILVGLSPLTKRVLT